MAEGEDTSFGQSQEILCELTGQRLVPSDGEAPEDPVWSDTCWSDDGNHRDSPFYNEGVAAQKGSEAETVTEAAQKGSEEETVTEAAQKGSEAETATETHASDIAIMQELPDDSMKFQMSRKCQRKISDGRQAEQATAKALKAESQERRRLTKPAGYWKAKSDRLLQMAAELEAQADAESQALKEQGQDTVRMPHFARVGPDLTRRGLEAKSL